MSCVTGAATPAAAYTPTIPPPNGVGTYPSYASRPVRYSTSSVRIVPPVATTRIARSAAIAVPGAMTPAAPVQVVQAPTASNVVRMVSAPVVVAPAPATPSAAAPTVPALPPTAPPLKLTEGVPDLAAIQSQREQFLRSLDEQEKQAMLALETQKNEQIANIRAHGERKKAAFNLEVEQQVQRHDLALSQQHGEHMMVLNQQYSTQRGVLEQQANSLVMEFQLKKAHEDMLMQQYQLQREMHDSQKRYEEEMGRIKHTDQSMQALPTTPQPQPVQYCATPYVTPMSATAVTGGVSRLSSYVPTTTVVTQPLRVA